MGAYGLLGSSLTKMLANSGYLVLRQGRHENADICIDPINVDSLKSIIANHSIDVVVNLIALTNVDQCEAEPQSAYKANVQVVEALVNAIKVGSDEIAPHLVQISTDQVYDGKGPHVEKNVNPCNVYASSKLHGEIIASRVDATIIRTNFYGRSHSVGRASLSDWIVHSLRAEKKITIFDDVLFNALHIETLCDGIELAIYKRHPGTFNFGCKDSSSKAKFALGLADNLDLDRRLMSIGRLQDIELQARRPLDMRMDCTYFESVFDYVTPTFKSQLELTAGEYRDA